MSDKLKKVRLKGNESFNFREGWLRKGMRCIEEEPCLFAQDDVMERLGVGSKMVRSIRFWLVACGLCEEQYINSGRARAFYISPDFGSIIKKYDKYFEDDFTLCLLHYNIVSNESLCTAWNIFFNDFKATEFTREDFFKVASVELEKKLEEGTEYSQKSFADDCSSVIRMYARTFEDDNIEENLSCPLSGLGLLRSNAKSTYTKTAPSRDHLDSMAILYVIVSNLRDGRNAVSINELVNGRNNIGKVFNLNRVLINEYLDQLRVSGYLTINRTAGLDMVYLKEMNSPSSIMTEYYEKAQVQ